MPNAVLPEYAFPAHASAAGHLSFFEGIALAGLENSEIRLSAADQRRLLGFPVFGKQRLRVSPSGEVVVSRSACFGTTREVAIYSARQVEAAITARRQLRPGS